VDKVGALIRLAHMGSHVLAAGSQPVQLYAALPHALAPR
jgi:hypothetical protein